MTRYARQIILPEIGPDGQERLGRARALVVGAGGLGVPVLQYLTGAGVGHITIVDGDRVDETNLHRQPLYTMGQIGKSKAEAAAEALHRLNPGVRVTARTEWLDPANAAELAAAADIVLDCADTFAASLTLSDICKARELPLITASALALSGYVAGCCGPAPSLRAIFPDLPRRIASCATAGVMGPLVGMIGSLQAQMALSVLLGANPSPLGQLLSFDARHWRMGGFRFDSAPEPSAPLPFIARSQITAEDLLVDLRTEASRPFHPNALHLPSDEIGQLCPSPDRRAVLACRTGLRAHNAGQALRTTHTGPIALLALPDTDT